MQNTAFIVMQPQLEFLKFTQCLKFQIWQNTKASVRLVEISSLFNLVDKTAKCFSTLFCCKNAFGRTN